MRKRQERRIFPVPPHRGDLIRGGSIVNLLEINPKQGDRTWRCRVGGMSAREG